MLLSLSLKNKNKTLMKKYTHPKNINSTLILKDGSSIKINWNFFKPFIKAENNFSNNNLWIIKKKFKAK